jgi:hypothetical protein
MTSEKVFSKRYEEFMQGTWEERHNPKAIAGWGVWRWKGLHNVRGHLADAILYCLHTSKLDVIDFGGRGGPLGFGSKIVDIADSNSVLTDLLKYKPGLIFSSHTLEHTDHPENYLVNFYAALSEGGWLYLHVPSVYGYKHWSPGAHKSRHPDNPHPHKWQFILNGIDDGANESADILSIDKLVQSVGFAIMDKRYCGDRSIMILGKKRDLA